MQVSSSSSVEVFWLDRKATVKMVKSAAVRLARAHPEIKRVLLFGSLARGDAVPGSDADVLIILSASDHPFLDRMDDYPLTGVPVGVDVFPYTERELAQMTGDNNRFVERALAEGVVLYERPDAIG